MPQTNLANWSFPEYIIPQRKRGWYVWAGLIFILLLFYAVFTANFLFGLIIIIVAIILFINHHKEPQKIAFAIHGKGISLGHKDYDFKEIKKFWLIYEPPMVKNLYLDFKSTFKPTLTVPLENENPIKIRKILKEYLEEDLEKESESTTEALARVFKL